MTKENEMRERSKESKEKESNPTHASAHAFARARKELPQIEKAPETGSANGRKEVAK